MKKKERIELILNNFLKIQGFNDVRAEYIETSDSYYEYDTIVLGGLTNVEADEIYLDYCKELGLEDEIGIEALSFLHELGHHNTIELVSDDDYYESESIKLMLYMIGEETEERYMQYFSCPTEKAATLDAIEFCNQNPKVIKEFDGQLIAALYEE